MKPYTKNRHIPIYVSKPRIKLKQSSSFGSRMLTIILLLIVLFADYSLLNVDTPQSESSYFTAILVTCLLFFMVLLKK